MYNAYVWITFRFRCDKLKINGFNRLVWNDKTVGLKLFWEIRKQRNTIMITFFPSVWCERPAFLWKLKWSCILTRGPSNCDIVSTRFFKITNVSLLLYRFTIRVVFLQHPVVSNPKVLLAPEVKYTRYLLILLFIVSNWRNCRWQSGPRFSSANLLVGFIYGGISWNLYRLSRGDT